MPMTTEQIVIFVMGMVRAAISFYFCLIRGYLNAPNIASSNRTF